MVQGFIEVNSYVLNHKMMMIFSTCIWKNNRYSCFSLKLHCILILIPSFYYLTFLIINVLFVLIPISVMEIYISLYEVILSKFEIVTLCTYVNLDLYNVLFFLHNFNCCIIYY